MSGAAGPAPRGSAESEARPSCRGCTRATAWKAISHPGLYEPVIAEVGPDRRWRFPVGLDEVASPRARARPAAAIERIAALKVEVMVPQMFCLPGMTEYRALFDVFGIPYVGNRPATMALGAHKARAKAVVAAAGVAVPRGEVVRAGEPTAIATPAVVKPVDGDNSDGLTFVRDRSGERRRSTPPPTRRAALVEEYVALGREVRCGMIERDGELVALPLEEYAVSEPQTVRDADDKLAATTRRADARRQAADATRGSSTRDDPICEPSGRPRGAATSRWAAVITACSTFASTRRGAPGFWRPACTARLRARASSRDGACRRHRTRELFATRRRAPLRPAPARSAEKRITILDPIGAEVTGLDVSGVSGETVAQLSDLLASHGVLVLRGQTADDQRFVEFLQSFGELAFTKGETPVPGHPDLNLVCNEGRATPPRSTFHVDTSYIRRPPTYTALRAVKIPPQGGETLFTNQYRAYTTLPATYATRSQAARSPTWSPGSSSTTATRVRPSIRCSPVIRSPAAPRSTYRRRAGVRRSAG